MNADRDPQLSLEHNRRAWDQMAHDRHALTRPANDEELASPLRTIDQVGWLRGGIQGWNVLCLAAGGGRHGPLYAAAGGRVTVVDLSPAMLDIDRHMAKQHKLSVRTLETSMDRLDRLTDGEFDLVIHPVSSCYLPSLERLFPEIARVTRAGGIYISQHKQPINLQASLQTFTGQYAIEHAYYDRAPVPRSPEPSRLREPGTREYVHGWQSLLGGICRSGFQITDVTEPNHSQADSLPGSFGHRCNYIAPYVRIKAVRNPNSTSRLVL